MFQLSLFRCCKNSLPCPPSPPPPTTTRLLHWSVTRTLDECVCQWLGSSHNTPYSRDIGALERRQWRMSTGWQTVLEEVNVHRATRQMEATQSWHICAPPRLLILTHHLKKEVKAAIRSSHSVSQVACHMLDRAPSAVHLFFLLLHHGVGQWWSEIAQHKSILPHTSPVARCISLDTKQQDIDEWTRRPWSLPRQWLDWVQPTLSQLSTPPFCFCLFSCWSTSVKISRFFCHCLQQW